MYVRSGIRIKGGEQAYEKWRDSLLTDSEFQKKYRDEAAKKELWSQLVKEIQPFLFQETAASFPLLGLKKLKAKRDVSLSIEMARSPGIIIAPIS